VLESQARSLQTHVGSPEQLPNEMYELLAQCSNYCKTLSRRCLSPPHRCGSCLVDFVERDGLCFPKYNPADEVDTWKQPFRAVDSGDETHNRPIIDDEDEFSRPNDLLNENNDNPEIEDDTEEGTQKDEPIEIDSEKRLDSADVPTGSETNKQEPAKQPEDKSKPVDKTIQYHQMPTPAAMVQLAVRKDSVNPLSEFYTLAIVVGCAVVSIFVLVGAGLCYYRYHQNAKATGTVEYPAFGPGPAGAPREQRAGSGDRKLAQSAQMYHYQHQKQQMIAAERASDELNKDEESEDEENEEGDYTVYECPGLAPTGEMEVKNPLFADEGAAVVNGSGDSPKKD